ncbi:MAG TPA: hypothetical protein VE890_02665, partial [Thermoguttaceae bacterium]|nr:hypothetical protein [Thermoguttaceae bacterium]
MTNLGSKLLVALVLVSLTVCVATAADKAATPFNGKNLDGWAANGGTLQQSKWTVGIAKVDPNNPGALVADPTAGKPGDLVTPEGHGLDLYSEAKFGDCVVELEVM